MSRYGDQEEASARLRSLSGDTDRAIVLLVRAEDVLDPEPLQQVHDLSLHFRGEPAVDRVESLTVTLPARRGGGEDDELTLEELEALEEAGGDDAPAPEVCNALDALVRAEPERFPGGAAQLSEVAGGIEDTPPVEGAQVTAAEAAELRRALEDAPLVEGRLVSRDRTVTAVVLRLSDDVQGWDAVHDAVCRVDAWLADNPPPAGVTRITGGLPHLWAAVVDEMVVDQTRLVPLTLLACVVLLLLSFRWWPATVLPTVAVGVTAVLVAGAMAAIGEPMNILNNVIPALLIILGVTDSIHLINRYREEIRNAGDRREAGRRTVRSMAAACLLTSATTAVGLGSLVVSRTELLRRFAVTAAAGVMIAYVVTLAFLPPALTAFRSPPVPPERGPRAGAGSSGASWPWPRRWRGDRGPC